MRVVPKDIHALPRIGFEETCTSAFCREVIAKEAFAVEDACEGLHMAFRALWNSGEGPAVPSSPSTTPLPSSATRAGTTSSPRVSCSQVLRRGARWQSLALPARSRSLESRRRKTAAARPPHARKGSIRWSRRCLPHAFHERDDASWLYQRTGGTACL